MWIWTLYALSAVFGFGSSFIILNNTHIEFFFYSFLFFVHIKSPELLLVVISKDEVLLMLVCLLVLFPSCFLNLDE